MIHVIEAEAAIALLVAIFTMITFVCWLYDNRKAGSR
jgi:hypothetical protein